LRLHYILGAALGFLGAGLIVTGGTSLSFRAEYTNGYGLALLAALIWSSYSVLSRRFAYVPTDAVTGFCLATALLAGMAHLALEQTIWPATIWQWGAVLGLGLGPVGFAFYVWDIGVKHGDIQVLGAASYAAPLLSTLVLVAAGLTVLTPAITWACGLITLGAVVAARDMIFKRTRH